MDLNVSLEILLISFNFRIILFFFVFSIFKASVSYSGAIIISKNSSLIFLAVLLSIMSFVIKTPPKAEIGSPASASFQQSNNAFFDATPQGLLCFKIQNVVLSKSKIKLMESLVDWEKEDFEDFANLYPDQYWSSVDIDTHIWLAKIIYKKPRTKKITVNFKTLKKTDSLLLVVMAPDNPGLFSEIAAAISTQEINIETAKIFTRKDGIAADFFWISPGNRLIFNKSTSNSPISSG